ncbi:esterase/lipase [Streptomyces sp. 1114.5]|uniref:alpha/beta hydrolase n=1 Tax=unclassified Streptomyces TaxID=2593676 RepID=UPI000BCAE4E7|nr:MULTISPECIES: alpha/beta fold hydrolase [unclassified Streptomyces]RKT18368.1 esterase/lipase [Streptomyces sp. 1114.5]SOB84563.1 carboxylesterase [Streptomyces sp. 1331.2]
MPLLPGAEPYRHRGGPVGVLLCHGFTGSPQSLRPWAEDLAAAGYTVSLPLLPGHGTRWQDMQLTRWEDWYAEVERELLTLADECEQVFVFALSMGGALALRLAALHGPTVSGLVLVNPSVRADTPASVLLPVLRHLVPSVPGIVNDIAKAGSTEVGYHRTPLHAAWSLSRLWREVQRRLPEVTQPVLLFHSPQDHVVSPANSELVLARISSTDVTERLCGRSFHVATLDHDAAEIFAAGRDFIRRLVPAHAAGATRVESDDHHG